MQDLILRLCLSTEDEASRVRRSPLQTVERRKKTHKMVQSYEHFVSLLQEFWDSASRADYHSHIRSYTVPAWIGDFAAAARRINQDHFFQIVRLFYSENNNQQYHHIKYIVAVGILHFNAYNALCILQRVFANDTLDVHMIRQINSLDHKETDRARVELFLENIVVSITFANQKLQSMVLNKEIGKLIQRASELERNEYNLLCGEIASRISSSEHQAPKLYMDAFCSRINNDLDIESRMQTFSVRSSDSLGYRKMEALAACFDVLFDRFKPLEIVADHIVDILDKEDNGIALNDLGNLLMYSSQYSANIIPEIVFQIFDDDVTVQEILKGVRLPRHIVRKIETEYDAVLGAINGTSDLKNVSSEKLRTFVKSKNEHLYQSEFKTTDESARLVDESVEDEETDVDEVVDYEESVEDDDEIPYHFHELDRKQYESLLQYTLGFDIPTDLGRDGLKNIIGQTSRDTVLAIVGKIRSLRNVRQLLSQDKMTLLREYARKDGLPDDGSLINVLNQCLRKNRKEVSKDTARNVLDECGAYNTFVEKMKTLREEDEFEEATSTPAMSAYEEEEDL